MGSGHFQSQVVVITGASSGIGRALALALARQGARLALASRNAMRLAGLAEQCQAAGASAISVPTDVSQQAQCKALIDQTVARYGRVDMLINNAGMAMGAFFRDLPDLSHFEYVMAVNYWGMVYCTHYALPHLIAAHGRIVNVSSLGGRVAILGNTPYCSSKFAMQGFSDSLRLELASHGVSVTVVSPYWVVTEFHEHMLNKDGQAVGPPGRSLYTRRMMSAETCAARILRAAARRRRDLLMGPGPLAVLLQTLTPRLVDWLVIEAFMKPAMRRRARAEG